MLSYFDQLLHLHDLFVCRGDSLTAILALPCPLYQVTMHTIDILIITIISLFFVIIITMIFDHHYHHHYRHQRGRPCSELYSVHNSLCIWNCHLSAGVIIHIVE